VVQNKGGCGTENFMKISDILKRNIFLLVFIAALLFYGVSAGLKIREQSKTPQYVYLAYSFLQGKTNLLVLPKSTYDLIFFEEKWYVPGGITPALLLLPFVAFFGKTFSDVLFSVFTGALNVAIMYSLLGRLVEKSSTRFWLTFLFAFGTVHWWLASVGSVWFNAQLVALLFMILFVRDAIQNRPWLAGLWLGLALLSRPPTLFSALFYLLIILSQERAIQPILKKLIPFGLMLIGSVAIMLTYNQLRFGNPMDFGYGYVSGSNSLVRTFALSGGFNTQYMPCNIYVSLLGTPNIDLPLLPGVNEVCSYLEPINHDFGKLSKFFNPLGMSIFLTTPALLLIFRAKLRDDLVIPAWVGMIGILIPLGCIMRQAGYNLGIAIQLTLWFFFLFCLAAPLNKRDIWKKY